MLILPIITLLFRTNLLIIHYGFSGQVQEEECRSKIDRRKIKRSVLNVHLHHKKKLFRHFSIEAKHYDPDNRFMALNDLKILIQEYSLLTNFRDQENNLKEVFLSALNDQNLNVKGVGNTW